VKSKETLQEYIVDLTVRTCRCHDWKAQEYPCGHASAVIIGRKENPQTYANDCFTLKHTRTRTKESLTILATTTLGAHCLHPPLRMAKAEVEAEAKRKKKETISFLPAHVVQPEGRRKDVFVQISRIRQINVELSLVAVAVLPDTLGGPAVKLSGSVSWISKHS